MAHGMYIKGKVSLLLVGANDPSQINTMSLCKRTDSEFSPTKNE